MSEDLHEGMAGGPSMNGGLANEFMVASCLNRFSIRLILVWVVGSSLCVSPTRTEPDLRQEPQEPSKINVVKQSIRARKLLLEGAWDEATVAYVWLWKHGHEVEPAYSGVRRSFLLAEIEQLCAADDGARRAFLAIRDAGTAAIEEHIATEHELFDWVVLNRCLNEAEVVLQWYDKTKGREGAQSMFNAVEQPLYDVLVEHERLADAGGILKSPLSFALHRATSSVALYAESDLETGERPSWEECRERLNVGNVPQEALPAIREVFTEVYAACLSAGRIEEAGAVASSIMSMDPTPEAEIALVVQALAVGEARELHRDLLREARQAGASVDEIQSQLDRALNQQDP